jgi:hypothetical protein
MTREGCGSRKKCSSFVVESFKSFTRIRFVFSIDVVMGKGVRKLRAFRGDAEHQ